MAAGSSTIIKLNQCLFGYDDGHRLLSASMKLPEGAASLLLLQSDLVPGLNWSSSEGYWTGIPIPAAKAYALMRTWPAPEMSRPGCVWTHVILLSLADMARLPNLGVLGSLFIRPSVAAGFATYADPLSIDPLTATAAYPTRPSRQGVLRVLRSLYAAGSQGILQDSDEPIDGAIFAVWSQQWPRLRRTFSFRTAGSITDPSNNPGYNLRVVQGPASNVSLRDADEFKDPADWELAAIDDLLSLEPSHLRRFLWRYGSDVRRGRERYRFLARLFLATRFPTLENAILTRFLDNIVIALPDADDGKLLKEDLLSCGRSTYSLLPTADPIDTLDYFINRLDLSALPPLPEATFEALDDLWTTRASEILALGERAVTKSVDIAGPLLHHLTIIADADSFLAISANYPVIRERLIRANPVLLDSPDLATLPPNERSALLALLPDNEDLASRVLKRLLFSDDRDTATFFADRFPSLTRDRVFDSLIAETTGTGRQIPKVWPDAVRQRSSDLITTILRRVASTTALGVLVVWLGLDVNEGLEASPKEWATAVARLDDDILGAPRQKLLTYLLAIALARPCLGCEPLFEIAFESVHADIMASRLQYDAFNVLARFLPDLYWWQQWDTCFRLRRAVVEAYIDAELEPQSFRRLTRDGRLSASLTDIASETSSGRRLIQRAFH